MEETKRQRGRPRPPETIARDERILELLRQAGPQSRNAIAEGLGLGKTIVYLALDRLRRQGRVRTCSGSGAAGTLWSSEVDAPCP